MIVSRPSKHWRLGSMFMFLLFAFLILKPTDFL